MYKFPPLIRVESSVLIRSSERRNQLSEFNFGIQTVISNVDLKTIL